MLPRSNRTRPSRHTLGERAETLVCDLLRGRGYRILHRNLRVGRAEIDIVAERGRTLVFCEVRARTRVRPVHPLETIDRAKVRRIREAAARWVASSDLRGRALRFDAASVIFERPEGVIDYVENAF